MLTKKKLISTLQSLPEKFSVEDVIDRIVLLQKVELGLEQSKAGKTKSTREAKAKLKKWL
jgi:hypothetical protein